LPQSAVGQRRSPVVVLRRQPAASTKQHRLVAGQPRCRRVAAKRSQAHWAAQQQWAAQSEAEAQSCVVRALPVAREAQGPPSQQVGLPQREPQALLWDAQGYGLPALPAPPSVCSPGSPSARLLAWKRATDRFWAGYPAVRGMQASTRLMTARSAQTAHEPCPLRTLRANSNVFCPRPNQAPPIRQESDGS
jgi:hypothetical protein